jgi:hypothetical protein
LLQHRAHRHQPCEEQLLARAYELVCLQVSVVIEPGRLWWLLPRSGH